MQKICLMAIFLLSLFAEDKIAFPDVPEKLTSLGAAIVDNTVYLYGGHTGKPHSYSWDEQSGRLWKLKLDGKSKWEKVTENGTHMQGLAMVTYRDSLYRIGGFTAKNRKGKTHDLWSTNEFFRYSIVENKWYKLPPLPQETSSHNAAILEGKIYLVGGWKMAAGEKKWHQEVYVFDVTVENGTWKKVAPTPFQRRAHGIAALDGKIYAIGGMEKGIGPTAKVGIYDIKTNKWSEGPSLKGSPIGGFGCSATIQQGQIYVSTVSGTLQRLDREKNEWISVDINSGRFFHQMLSFGKKHFVVVAGGNRYGKIAKVGILVMPEDK